MQRGRGRGRGQSGFRGGFGGPGSIPLKAVDTYIYNPNCDEVPELNAEERRLVVFTRLLKRHWNESPNFIQSHRTIGRPIESYFDQFSPDITDPKTQKRVIVDPIGAEYFPADLLSNTLNLKKLRGVQAIGTSTRAFNWAEIEKNAEVRAAQIGGEAPAAEGDEEPEQEPEEDFGGEDYGANYIDEDREDEYLDMGDEGGGGGDDY